MTALATTGAQKASVEWGRVLTGERPGEYTKLVPVEAARAVVAEIEADLARMPSDGDVHQMLRRLLGAYRSGQVHDPETYTELLRDELAAAPRWVGAKAVTEITRRLKWPPARAELVEIIEEVKAERRRLAIRAKQHLAEHDRRAAAEAERRALERERADPTMRARLDATLSGFLASVGSGGAA